jgi:hypothetical protein
MNGNDRQIKRAGNFSRLYQNHDQIIDHACVNLRSQTTIVIEEAQSI